MGTKDRSHPSAAAPPRSREFIRRAIEQSNLNALRVALLHATGDSTFASMQVEQSPLNSGSSSMTVVRSEDRPVLVELALRYLTEPFAFVEPPTGDEVQHLVETFVGRSITDGELRLSAEQLAFTSTIETVAETRDAVLDALPGDFRVLVIGGGFGGVATAIFLRHAGIPFTAFDRQPELGGTWLANHYPGVRVDIPTRYYQYTFEQDYPWKHQFAPGDEVRAYIDHVATKYGVKDHFQHGVEVTGATWDEEHCVWEVGYLKDGKVDSIRVNAIISASGLFNKPHLPNIAGLEHFKGPKFHTTAWPRDLDIKGKRIAVIGTGSTGSQLVPAIAGIAAHVTVFQRSPNWVSPIVGYHDPVSDETRWLLETVPYYSNWVSFGFHWQSTQDLPGLQVHDAAWQAAGGLINERNDKLREHLTSYIREQLGGDEKLIEKCVPEHAPWTRRMVRDNGWYDALRRPNVDLVTTPIDRVEEDAVLTTEGERYPVEVIVLSTGFATDEYLWPVEYIGRNGQSLAQAWERDGARAYLGMSVPGFPNLFILYGPNGQPRGGAITKWLEVWARYAVSAISTMLHQGAFSVEVTARRFSQYNAEMDEAMSHLIWESAGKSSYYVNQFGRSSVNLPWRPEHYYALVGAFDPVDYVFETRTAPSDEA